MQSFIKMGDSDLSLKTALDIPYIAFPDLLRKWSEKHPNKTGTHLHSHGKFSFRELNDEATNVAKALVQYEIQRGEIVAWMVEIFTNGSMLISA